MKLRKFFGKPKRSSFLLVRRVVGESMAPLLRPNRIVVGRARVKSLRLGDVVIIRHAGLEKIKRIQRVRGEQLFLIGDNQHHSTDSRSFGWLPKSVVQAKVVWPRRLSARS